MSGRLGLGLKIGANAHSDSVTAMNVCVKSVIVNISIESIVIIAALTVIVADEVTAVNVVVEIVVEAAAGSTELPTSCSTNSTRSCATDVAMVSAGVQRKQEFCNCVKISEFEFLEEGARVEGRRLKNPAGK